MTKKIAKNVKTADQAAADVEAQFNMQAAHDEINLSTSDDAMLASLLEEMTAENGVTIEGNDDSIIEAAVADIEKAEAHRAIYEGEESEAPVVTEADKPKTKKVREPKKAGEPKKAKEPKKAGEPKKADESKKADEPKKTKERMPTYVSNKPSEVLNARIGGKTDEMLLLEVGDIELAPDVLKKKQADLLALLNTRPGTGGAGSTQKKVAEKIVMLFDWMAKGGKLNEVIRRTFEVLARDGEIISGDKGNLHAALLAKPYSVGTCRAQAGQMMAMLPMLKIALKDGKGRLVANPDSLILMKAKADLGLS
jgi:hypothetical protein